MSDTDDWSAFPIGEEPAVPRIEFPESGWGMLIAWVVGPDRVLRSRDAGPVSPVRVTVARGDGTRETTYTERTRTDQAVIDTDIDTYLREADVPPQPSGYRWFLCPAPVGEEEFWGMVSQAERAAETGSPRDVHSALRAALPPLLG